MESSFIKQILLTQKEEIKKIFSEKIIERYAKNIAEKAFKDPLIKIITGVRRSGKSVLVHELLKTQKYGYINFDDERLLSVKAQELDRFLEVLKEIEPDFQYLFLDEVQNIEGWELFANRLHRLGYNIIITGSNARLLSKELATHLTGRHLSIELFPFSFKEFLAYHEISYDKNSLYLTEKRGQIKNLFNQYIEQGGFPELLHIELKSQYLRDLYEKILTKDIILRFNIKYVKDLKEIALYLISNFGNRISYNKIKNLFSLGSVHTVKNYVDYIEESYLIFQLRPFSFKLKNQLLQPKKVYAIDTGLIQAMSSRLTPDIGHLMENIVFIELLRRRQEVYFYTDNEQREVDFVVKQGLKIHELIQVCSSLHDEQTQKRELRSLVKASQELQCNEMLVITSDYESTETIKNKTIRFTPLWRWLLE